MRERMTGERRQTGDQPLASSPSSAPGSGWPIASSSLSSTAGAPAPLAPESAITGWPLSASSSADKAAINSSSSVSILFNATITGLSVRRSEEHTSELQSLMRISYAVFCLKKKTKNHNNYHQIIY